MNGGFCANAVEKVGSLGMGIRGLKVSGYWLAGLLHFFRGCRLELFVFSHFSIMPAQLGCEQVDRWLATSRVFVGFAPSPP